MEDKDNLSYEDARYVRITDIMHNIAKNGAEKVMEIKLFQWK